MMSSTQFNSGQVQSEFVLSFIDVNVARERFPLSDFFVAFSLLLFIRKV